MKHPAALALMLAVLVAAPAAEAQKRKAAVDYEGFAVLTAEAGAHRASRLVDLDRFKALAAEGDTLVLDARSAAAYRAGHIDGAVNLPFSDFTAEKLAAVIGDPSRRVLIYCNNNFADNAPPVVTKSPPLALNIPTFINLYGYGYRNIYELSEMVEMRDPRVQWLGERPQ